MAQWNQTLPHEAPYEPSQPDVFLEAVPGKWCVALLIDGADRPLQLVCAKNLRAMLKRRLEAPDESAPVPGKRVDYRALVRRVAWRRVDSDLQMDLVYIEAARAAFAENWRRLVPERSATFVSIDASQPFPDFTRRADAQGPGQAWGPFPDRAKADRWIDLARDAFDLCRYRNILSQTPNGKACAYKQMNKCPAPCDGTIPITQYHAMLRGAIDVLLDPAPAMESLQAQMKQDVAALEFEKAARVKQRMTTIEQFRSAPYQGVKPVGEFRFISVQPGPRKGVVRIYLCTASGVEEVAGVLDANVSWDELKAICGRAIPTSDWPADVLLGTICYHLGNARTSARFHEASTMTAERLAELIAAAARPATVSQDAEAVRETRLQV